jgi:hypothetical protein
MNKETLSSILQGKLFYIPDYQRGYAWETKQWNDFITDIDALIDEEVKNHYTGTIVIFQKDTKPTENYGIDKLEIVDIVDGQQRLTTCCLYLSILMSELIKKGLTEYEDKKQVYLFKGSKCKLHLNNDTNNFFFDLLTKGTTNTTAITVHQKRLNEAYIHLKKHIENQEQNRTNYIEYLQNVYDAITRKLNFTFYTIDKESEIGMTFELMNSRGQDLSILELLKNYLMHWIYRNEKVDNEQEDLTMTVNKAWKEVYTNISIPKGKEDQCLRIAWTLYCSHTPKYWEGYVGFKKNWVIPLRDFSKKSKDATKDFISIFANGLAEVSKHYAIIISPAIDKTTENEFKWLSKIHNAGNIANFLPLLVASRINFSKNIITELQYINIIRALELYAFRVFLWQGKRSNAGISILYRWAVEVFTSKIDIDKLPQFIEGLINWYSSETNFQDNINKPFNWYGRRNLLKYCLFEYELKLLQDEGKGKTPKLQWSDLSDATIEHILPQTPDERSHWKAVWTEPEIITYLHDIGNLVLTENNSNYRNFDFSRKKGSSGEGFSYANSDIRQERKISSFADWTAVECKQRHDELIKWMIQRWGIIASAPISIEISEDEDDDNDND